MCMITQFVSMLFFLSVSVSFLLETLNNVDNIMLNNTMCLHDMKKLSQRLG